MQPKVTFDTVVVHATHLFTSDVDDELVMFDSVQGKYFGLDPVSKRIWTLIGEERSVSSVCEQLLHEYDVAPTHCYEQTSAFIQSLVEANLVEVRHA